MNNLMDRALCESWLLCENPSAALSVRKGLLDCHYLYFGSHDLDAAERKIDTIGAKHYEIAIFYKKFDQPATIIKALFVAEPFEFSAPEWWDKFIVQQKQEAYVFGSGLKHTFLEFCDDGNEFSEIDCPVLFS